jgi:hypothetical protein
MVLIYVSCKHTHVTIDEGGDEDMIDEGDKEWS